MRGNVPATMKALVPLQKGKGIGLEFTESQEIYSAF